jgi:ribosome-associated protein YbcJ (S4-like RNA binding protein)
MTTEQLKGTRISSVGTFNKMLRMGWVDSAARAKEWFQHQRVDHDRQYEEERERKAGPKKFVKKDSAKTQGR